MLIRLKRIDRKEEESIMFNFPYEESEISNVYNQLELETSTAPNCYIEEVVYDSDMNEVLKGKDCNIDELNFLFKRMDSFDTKERKVFFASAFAENPKTIAELINLSFNTHCYSLVSDFSNLETVGKDLYLSEKQAVAVKELDELDGESFAMEVIKNNPNSRITPYGVLYKNLNVPEQIYNGKQFPPYQWKETVATLQLTVKGANEFIYLPCSDVEIEKALMRLATPYLHDCEVAIIDDNFSKDVLDIISADTTPLTKIDTLNKLAGYYKEIGNHDIGYFEKLMDYVKPRTIDEVFALADSMYEFELFDGIHSVESYGRYMICDSGHFEYDSNLEEYIDFKRYGQEKMAHEFGAFSEKGYITYHGYNQKLANLLFENLGMVFPEQEEPKTLKLYMPLRITTYDIENEYGYKEYANEPQEISNAEVAPYLDVILKAIEENNLPEEDQRGLMRYYDDHDSVNAKVSKYVFFVELVEGELMGVAILTLNDVLTPKELEKVKGNITGQASDGWGENFEQREISTDIGDIYVSFWDSDNWFIKTAEVIKEDEAEIVRRIFHEYLNGKGSYVIARYLNDDNVPTIRSAEEWQDSVVKEILQNPIYEGDLLLQKTYTTEVLPFERKTNKGEVPQYFIEDNHEPIITREEGQMVREIYEYRRNQMGVDDSGKYQNRYEFSSKIICKECGSTFRRQKIYIGKPYEKIQWCCIQHIRDISKCNMKAVREDIITGAFLTMWNKLVSNHTDILYPLLESLKKLRIDHEQEEEIEKLNNRIMELTEQSHILSRVVSKGYIDSAIFIERQNALTVELEAIKKMRNQCLDDNGYEKEITGTARLLEIIKYNPEIMEEYDENLFIHTVDNISIGENQEITFKLINDLELTERYGK